MKRSKILATVLAIAVVSASLYTAPTSAATSQISLNLSNVNTSSSTNNLGTTFQITNKGTSDINLSDLKIRYYYTEDGSQDQSFHCYYGAVSNPYKDVTGKITANFVKMATPTATADNYCEISFSSDVGVLAAGAAVSFQISINKSDWSNYNQSDDYSFNNSQNVVVYSGGSAIWGTDPVGGITPVATDSKLDKSEVDLEKDNLSDITINMELNGNIFTGIQGLTQGTDYTVNGTVVTIAKSYLQTLSVGDTNLTFNFNQGNAQTLKVTIKDSDQTNNLTALIGQVQAKAGDTVTIPVTLKGTPSAGIADFAYRIKYDPNVVEVVSVAAGDEITNKDNNFLSKVLTDKNLVSVLFIDSAVTDAETIKSEGILTNITLKVKDTAAQGSTAITFNDDDHSFYDINGNELKVAFESGSITIK